MKKRGIMDKVRDMASRIVSPSNTKMPPKTTSPTASNSSAKNASPRNVETSSSIAGKKVFFHFKICNASILILLWLRVIFECQKREDYQESIKRPLSYAEEYSAHGETVTGHGKDSHVRSTLCESFFSHSNIPLCFVLIYFSHGTAISKTP